MRLAGRHHSGRSVIGLRAAVPVMCVLVVLTLHGVAKIPRRTKPSGRDGFVICSPQPLVGVGRRKK
ncbi:exported hypothetical protein [Nostocoides australiense Ben110]|uniref:Uncharacterized protein n=1 Tax=Nostocoides australiense Ben110 TaxID=1193182 RepID=W6JUV7_9MICO|nr:exported hypothetical protein [Tetrasphaera australiensis Ben110]